MCKQLALLSVRLKSTIWMNCLGVWTLPMPFLLQYVGPVCKAKFLRSFELLLRSDILLSKTTHDIVVLFLPDVSKQEEA